MKTKTIGQRAEEEADKYFEIFKRFASDEDDIIKAKATALALNDLYAKKCVYEFAIEDLNKRIKQFYEEQKEKKE